MSSPSDQGPDSLYALAKNLQWLGIQTCICCQVYSSSGRLYNVSMGHAWHRKDTHPDCEHHGTEAQKRWTEAHRPRRK